MGFVICAERIIPGLKTVNSILFSILFSFYFGKLLQYQKLRVRNNYS